MDEHKPSGADSHHTPERIEQRLSVLREALEMDVAFVSKFEGDRFLFRVIEGDGESFGWKEGEEFPLDRSYCKRVIDGRISHVVPDAKGYDPTKDLWVTSEADIGSYAAVPLMLSDGTLYGTLCCVSHTSDPWLRDRDLRLMEKIAKELVERLERERRL